MNKRIIKRIAIILIVTLIVGSGMTGQNGNLFSTKIKAAVNSNNLSYKESIETSYLSEFSTEELTTEELLTEEPTVERPTMEQPSTEEPTTEQPTTEEPTTEEPTTQPEYEIINDVYKVKQGVLVEYLVDKGDRTVTLLVIPKSVTKIESRVFEGYKYINKVTFEEGSNLTEIGDYAFNKCEGLTSITLPEGLNKIGYLSFAKCTSLKTIKIPSTVSEGNRIVGKTTAVKKVTFSAGIKVIPNDILKYAYNVEKIVLKPGITTIGNRAFYHCKGLKSITIPSTVTTIKSSVFNGCTSLNNVEMSKNTSYIGTYAYKKCTSLKQLELKKAVKSFGRDVFLGDEQLTLLVYANSAAKAYARKYNVNWEYTKSEIKRRAASQEVYEKYKSVIDKNYTEKYKLKKLKNYVPQGLCIVGKYVVVSMYHKNLKKNSVLLLYNKNTGKYEKKIILPSKDHVGSITNVEGRLVLGLNNISTTDYVAIISYSKLKKIKNGKKIKYNYTRKLPGYADFAAYDGKIFWAGHSANSSNAKMYGYKVKIKKKKLVFTKKYSYTVPKNSQGLIVKKEKGYKRTFIFSQSYGRLNDSSLIIYSAKINKTKTLGEVKTEKLIPSMVEGICMTNEGYIYTVFESAAGLYCSNPDNTSEIQVKNICKMKYTDISKLKSK